MKQRKKKNNNNNKKSAPSNGVEKKPSPSSSSSSNSETTNEKVLVKRERLANRKEESIDKNVVEKEVETRTGGGGLEEKSTASGSSPISELSLNNDEVTTTTTESETTLPTDMNENDTKKEKINITSKSLTVNDQDQKEEKEEEKRRNENIILKKEVEINSQEEESKEKKMIRKVSSDLVTVRLPIKQVDGPAGQKPAGQKPPLPPHHQHNSYQATPQVLKSHSLMITPVTQNGFMYNNVPQQYIRVPAASSTSFSNGLSQKAVFKSSSFKALVAIPSPQELRQINSTNNSTPKKQNTTRVQTSTPPSSGISASVLFLDRRHQQQKQQQQQLVASPSSKPLPPLKSFINSDITPCVRQILIDLVNLQKIQPLEHDPLFMGGRRHHHHHQIVAPFSRTLRQGGTGVGQPAQTNTEKQVSSNNADATPIAEAVTDNTKSSSKPDEVTTKKYKKVPPTPNNTRKLVAQVLKDLVQLYKVEKSDAKRANKPTKQPTTYISSTSSPIVAAAEAAAACSKPPIEIKIRKLDDKIIIKSSEPVIINTTPDEPPVVTKTTVIDQSERPSRSRQVFQQQPNRQHHQQQQQPHIREYKLRTSASVDQFSPQALTKAASLQHLAPTPVLSPGPKRIRYLGIVDADPEDYRRRYANELVKPHQLPEFVHHVQAPNNIKLAAEMGPAPRLYELEGDLDVFKHINLEKG